MPQLFIPKSFNTKSHDGCLTCYSVICGGNASKYIEHIVLALASLDPLTAAPNYFYTHSKENNS